MVKAGESSRLLVGDDQWWVGIAALYKFEKNAFDMRLCIVHDSCPVFDGTTGGKPSCQSAKWFLRGVGGDPNEKKE